MGSAPVLGINRPQRPIFLDVEVRAYKTTNGKNILAERTHPEQTADQTPSYGPVGHTTRFVSLSMHGACPVRRTTG